MTFQFYTLLDAARQVGVKPYRIRYAEDIGKLPQPQQMLGIKVYSPTDIRNIQTYFTKKEAQKNANPNRRNKRQQVPSG